MDLYKDSGEDTTMWYLKCEVLPKLCRYFKYDSDYNNISEYLENTFVSEMIRLLTRYK